jgi:hypothetical protein
MARRLVLAFAIEAEWIRPMNPRHAGCDRVLIDQVFILRFWHEISDCSGDVRWRAQVRNVGTRESQLADNVEAAFAIVAAQLNDASVVKATNENKDIGAGDE